MGCCLQGHTESDTTEATQQQQQQQCIRFSLFLNPHQHWLSSVFLILTIPVDVMRVLGITVLVFISLALKDCEHLLVYILTLCIHSSEKWLVKSPTHFKNCVFVPFIRVVRFLYMFWLLLLLLSCFSRVRLCATLQMAAHQAPPSLGFSRQEHWSGVPFPSPMHESEK